MPEYTGTGDTPPGFSHVDQPQPHPSQDKPAQLSACHNAPVVVCRGNTWDIPPESIQRGSTYYYGCTECHEACDLATPPAASESNKDAVTGALPTDDAVLDLDHILAQLVLPIDSSEHERIRIAKAALLAWHADGVAAALQKLRDELPVIDKYRLSEFADGERYAITQVAALIDAALLAVGEGK